MDILNSPATTPVTRPSTIVTDEQLELARKQGDAVRATLDLIVDPVHWRHAGDYVIAFYSTPAQGRHGRDDGLRWREPAPGATTHLAVVVLDAVDNRFIPGLDVTVDIWRTEKLLTVALPFEWHPALYHYGADAALPDGGVFGVVIRITAAGFLRHDQINGLRYAEPVVATLPGTELVHGRNVSPRADPRGRDITMTGADRQPG